MRIDLQAEKLITLRHAREHVIPRRNRRPIAPSTLWRRIHRGCRAADGTFVKLGVAPIGGTPMTTCESVLRFFAELTERTSVVTDNADADGSQARPNERLQQLQAAGLLES
jgi:hypothetical protein